MDWLHNLQGPVQTTNVVIDVQLLSCDCSPPGFPALTNVEFFVRKTVKNFKTVTTEPSANSRSLLNSKFCLTTPKKLTVTQVHTELALY